MVKTALITGISGQDGAYLAQWLLAQGYHVWGSSRDAEVSSFRNLEQLGIRQQVKTLSISLNDFRSVLQGIRQSNPEEIYNLAGQSSVGLSFEQPVETLESVAIGTLNLLESIRFLNPGIRLYQAASSECFGNTKQPANEQTPFYPRSPYAVAKATSFWTVANYREAYGLYACSGILFNHDSPLRPERFVTQKIVATACRIAQGSRETLVLGNMDIRRDWGWAPEYVIAMYRMLQQDKPEDYVVATGASYSLQAFVETAFQCVGLNWQDHVVQDPRLFRPSDIAVSLGDPSLAQRQLGWQAQSLMPDVVRLMVTAQQHSPTPNKPL
ncbi:MAG: GDP-mannose 4,6-dehydratase [Synechococcales cyanobacterium]